MSAGFSQLQPRRTGSAYGSRSDSSVSTAVGKSFDRKRAFPTLVLTPTRNCNMDAGFVLHFQHVQTDWA